MLWHVRALLEDRPGALASLAASCGEQNVNVLGLEIFPTADGRVLDALVLHTPGGWDASDVEQLCLLAGATGPTAVACSAHALEDQPVRWVRAAASVAAAPARLETQLARLLEALPDEGTPGMEVLVLDGGPGPTVRLTRGVAFTEAEVARATELRRLAAAALATREEAPPPGASQPSPTRVTSPAATLTAPAPTGTPVLRAGTAADVPAVLAMHERCSAETLRRRYHAPAPRLRERLALALLEPAGGQSMVLVADEEVVGVGMLVEGPDGTELGLMIEDRWQRQGHGTRMLRALAVEAARRGADEVVCAVEPDNDAVLRTIGRSGLRALVSYADGLTQYKVLVARLAGRGHPRRRSNRPAMGEITTPLVSLLHERSELREIYRPAAAIDQAVRGGA